MFLPLKFTTLLLLLLLHAKLIFIFFIFWSVGTEREIEIGITRTQKAATRGAAKENRDKNFSFTETKR